TRIAEAHGEVDGVDEGLRLSAEALEAVERYDERFCEAEVHLIKGRLLLRNRSGHHDAEAAFQKSLDIARRQQARSVELRAATDLARLWHRRDRRGEARDLLGEVYRWFTEGFDTADLRDARALLTDLG